MFGGLGKKDLLLVVAFIVAMPIAGTTIFMAVKQAISCNPSDPFCRQGGLGREQKLKK
jgi:hypothetical protein